MFLSLLVFGSLAFSASTTEVQVNICDDLQTLSEKIDFLNWKRKTPEESFLVDTKNLDFYKAGWTFKVKVDRDNDTAQVTLKNNVATHMDDDLNCEYDLHGATRKLACKLSNDISLQDFMRAKRNRNLASLISDEQRQWMAKEGVSLPGNLEMTTLFQDQDFVLKNNGLKIVLGVTKSARRDVFVEISARTDEGDERHVQKELLQFLQNQNVQLCQDQGRIMTRLKLESYFGHQ